MKSAPENNYAIILGASSGFGAGTAIELAKRGFHIIGIHLDRAAGMRVAEETKAAIEAEGVRAHFFNMNAVDADKRKEVIDWIGEEFKNLEKPMVRVLLHSLAFGTLKPLVSQNPGEAINQKQLEMTLDVMGNSLVYWTQDLVFNQLMREGGRIFGLSSGGAARCLPMYGAVSAAKSAMEAYIRQLALELAPFGITANTILAGVTDTAALRKIPGNSVIMNNAKMRNPHHRLTTPEDVGRAIALLCHEDSYWMTGDIIGVNGGENVIDLTWWEPSDSE